MTDRKHFNASTLFSFIRAHFSDHEDLQKLYPERNGRTVTITDALMSALAVFSLKFPSLLQFDKNCSEPTIRHTLAPFFGVEKAPSDTYIDLGL